MSPTVWLAKIRGSLDCGGIGFAVIMIEGAYELFAKGWGWLRKVACSLFVLLGDYILLAL